MSGALYRILTKGLDDEAIAQPYLPNEAQLDLYRKLSYRQLVLKARQRGFTTAIAIYLLDCALFRPDVRAGVIAHTDDAAKAIFRDKVKYAYDHLPGALRKAFPLATQNASELVFAHNNSSIRVSTSMRGMTLQYLHVSEFGKICAQFPKRATEVITGSLPSVPENGVVFIESTAEGRSGPFYTMSQRAQALAETGAKLGRKDYRFHFCPWFGATEYRTDAASVPVSAKDHQYFDSVELTSGVKLDAEQRAWYVQTRDTQFAGQEDMMWREYPSTPEECWKASVEGAYYTAQLSAARKAGRIGAYHYVPGHAVNTFWDIGNSDGTAVWLHQRIENADRFFAFVEDWGEPYAHYVSQLRAMAERHPGWRWGSHYLPHDTKHERQGMLTNQSAKEMLEQLGLRRVVIVPRIPDIIIGINATRTAFAAYHFDEAGCKEGLAHLANYRKTWNENAERWSDEPCHDVHSEAADALRQHGQMFAQQRASLYAGAL